MSVKGLVFIWWVLCETVAAHTPRLFCHFMKVIQFRFYLQHLIISVSAEFSDGLQCMTLSMYPASWCLLAGTPPLAKAQTACVCPFSENKKGTRSYQVSRKYSRKITQGRDVLGFQERQTVISKCFLASSGCLTKAAGECYWRIRLVAFLWLLMSGGFGLCLESQWSKRHVSFCGAGYWLWLSKQCFFSVPEQRAVHVVVDHFALVAGVWCSPSLS